MSNMGQAFVVEVRRKPNADYASKPGDARRQGRVNRPLGKSALTVSFVDAGGRVEARLGVVTVATISVNPAGGGYLWALFLPMFRPGAQPAADLDKAKSAVDFKVREWCEAAKLISAKSDAR